MIFYFSHAFNNIFVQSRLPVYVTPVWKIRFSVTQHLDFFMSASSGSTGILSFLGEDE